MAAELCRTAEERREAPLLTLFSALQRDSLTGGRNRATGQDAGNVTLVLRTGVDIAEWRNRLLHVGCDGVDRSLGAFLPDQGGGRGAGVNGRLADPAQRKPEIRATLVIIERNDGRDACQRKVTSPPRKLHEAASRPRCRLGKC